MSSKPEDNDLVPAAASASVNLTDLSTEITESPKDKTLPSETLSTEAVKDSEAGTKKANSLMKQHAKDMKKASEQLDKQLIRRVRVLPAYIGQYAITDIINQNDGRFLVEARPLPDRIQSRTGKYPPEGEETPIEWLLICSAPLEDDDIDVIESGEIDTLRIKQLFRQFDWATQFQDLPFILPEDAGFDKGWIYISLGQKSTWDLRTPLSKQRLKHTAPRSKGIATAKMLLEICYILSELHERGVAHGNVHPGRIWRNKTNGNWEIAGLAIGDADAVEMFQIDNPWSFIAPEWRRDVRMNHPGGIPTPQADIYSIASIAIWLLTGESPVSPQKSWEKTLLESFPRSLAILLWQSLQHRTHRRPTSMAIYIHELEDFLLKADYRSTPARENKCLEIEEASRSLSERSESNVSVSLSILILLASIASVALGMTSDYSDQALLLAMTALFTWAFHHCIAFLRRSGLYVEKILQALFASLPIAGRISGLLVIIAMGNIYLMISYIIGRMVLNEPRIPQVFSAVCIALTINFIEHALIFRLTVARRTKLAEDLHHKVAGILERGLPIRMAFNLMANATRKSKHDNWEQVFETFKGYTAKVKARTYYGFKFNDQHLPVERPRYMRWRDWVLGHDTPNSVLLNAKIDMQQWMNRANKNQIALTESIHDWRIDDNITLGDMFMVHPIHQSDPAAEDTTYIDPENSPPSKQEDKKVSSAQIMTLDPEETTEELNFAFDKTSPLDSKLGTKTMYFSSLDEAKNPKKSKVEHIARATRILLDSDLPGLSYPLREDERDNLATHDQEEKQWQVKAEDWQRHIKLMSLEARLGLAFSFFLAILLFLPTSMWLSQTTEQFSALIFMEHPFFNLIFHGLTPAIASFALLLSCCFLTKRISLIMTSIFCLLCGMLNALPMGIALASSLAMIAIMIPVLTIPKANL